MSVPTFNGSSINQSASKKTQDTKDKTQLFLSKKISPEFIKRVLKPGDSIDFNYEVVINESGHPIPNKTKVNTTNTNFNSKIIRYLNILPKFTPAVASFTKAPYQYLNNTDAEFYVNDAYKLIPIYRINISDIYKIETSHERVISLYDSVNKNKPYKSPLKSTVYFSTTNNKKITNIKVYTNNIDLKKIVADSIEKIKLNNPDIYSTLEVNKNYTLNSFVQKKGPDRYAVYQGCNENLENLQVLKCTSEKISKLINKNFNTDLAKNLGITGRQKIFIGFKIDTEGNVFDVNARVPHPKLKEEAIRVIRLIPKMKPASLNGKPIITPYSIPLIFVVEPEKPRKTNPYYNSRRY